MTHAEQLEQLYVFGVYMLGSREAAFEATCEATARHPGNSAAWLADLVAQLIAGEKTRRFDHFSELDDILRTNTTIPVDLGHPLVQGDARRLHVLLSELRRTCLITTLRSLAPERRAIFILLHVLGLSVEHCATICNTTPNAVRVADGRGRRELDNYLGARCEHLDPGNACHCVARLGNALEQGLVAWPRHNERRPSTLTRSAASLPAAATRRRVDRRRPGTTSGNGSDVPGACGPRGS